MLLTISTTHQPATDLGYLLHKHPDRVQRFEQSFGTATVFYPEATEQRCTASLLLEVDPIRLVRSRAKTPDFSLAQYVNDRPYAASSLLGVAMADVFSTARSGVCKANQELADSPIPLEVAMPVVPCRGGVSIAQRIFEPLGWQVTAEPIELDERFPDWGNSRYVSLTLTGTQRLADALRQLHVLLPVLDESKHYWQGPDEVDKLLRSGEDWLPSHPEKDLITRRYLGRNRAMARAALARLAEIGDDVEDTIDPDPEVTKNPPLNQLRHEAVLDILRSQGATSVIDLGCGPGAFLARLLDVPQFVRVAGTDVSVRSLQIADRRLRGPRVAQRRAERLELFQSALTYSDDRYAGFDAAVLMEVIEHLDESRLPALERVVFAEAQPHLVVVTTPNREYNAIYELAGMRHSDHRFEWDRAQFAAWSERVACAYGYRVTRQGVGQLDETLGQPTQIAVFVKEGGSND